MKYLKLFEEFNELDFTNYDSVAKWVIKNIDLDSLYTEEDMNILSELGEERITDYMVKYKEVTHKNEIEIYRLVMLHKIEDLNLNKIGEWWSFEPDGVGSYGFGGGDKHDSYVLTGIINVKDIDWERGFYSFMCYGKDQFECNVKHGSKVIITQINDDILEEEIEGII